MISKLETNAALNEQSWTEMSLANESLVKKPGDNTGGSNTGYTSLQSFESDN